MWRVCRDTNKNPTEQVWLSVCRTVGQTNQKTDRGHCGVGLGIDEGPKGSDRVASECGIVQQLKKAMKGPNRI